MPSSRAKVRARCSFFSPANPNRSREIWLSAADREMRPGSFDGPQGIPLVAGDKREPSRQNTSPAAFAIQGFHRARSLDSVRVDRWIETRHGSPPLGMTGFFVNIPRPSEGAAHGS